MSKKRSRRRIWAALLGVVLLLAGVAGAFRAGTHVGYTWGAMRAPQGDEEGDGAWGLDTRWDPRSYGLWSLHRGYRGRPMHGGFLGRLFSTLLILLGLGALFKLLRHKAWHIHRAHAAGGPSWHHGPWEHGPWGHGPACWGERPADKDADEPPSTEEQVAKVQPDPDAQ